MSTFISDKSSFHFDSGYQAKNRIITYAFNFVTASILLILSFPIFMLISVLIKLQDGGSVYYAGSRLGKDNVYHLHPPIGGFKKSSKVAAPKGILGKNEDITKLVGRML